MKGKDYVRDLTAIVVGIEADPEKNLTVEQEECLGIKLSKYAEKRDELLHKPQGGNRLRASAHKTCGRG